MIDEAEAPASSRSRTRVGALLVLVGVALLIVGSTLAWNTTALLGFLVGSAGLLGICVGAIIVRQGMVGHFAMGNGTVEEDEP